MSARRERRVTIVGTLAYRVVWNDPVAAYFPDHDYYRPRSRTIVLVRIRQPRRGVQFEVPKVAPNRYAVVIYDGAEGSDHYTWNFFQVKSFG